MAMVTDMSTGTGMATVVLAVTVIEDSKDIPTYDNNGAGEDMGAKSGGTRSGKNTDSIIGNECYRNGNSNGGDNVELVWEHSIGSSNGSKERTRWKNGGVDGGTHGIGGNDGITSEKVEAGMAAEGLRQQGRS